MRLESASVAGGPDRPTEDWISAAANLVVVLDGATARVDTGCVHGVAWYTARLGTAFARTATDPSIDLATALAAAIEETAAAHRSTCDLSNVGTPSAAVGALRLGSTHAQYLVLGDVTVVLDNAGTIDVIVDDRVDATATAERRQVDQYPIGSAEKSRALVKMKIAELAARNRPDGFWIAAADSSVTTHALTGQVDLLALRQAAVLTDGAARIVKVFGALDWPGLLDVVRTDGPAAIVRRVRLLEAGDPVGVRWPRNKSQDDASLVYVGQA